MTLQINIIHVLSVIEPLLYWLKFQIFLIQIPLKKLKVIHIGMQLLMKNIFPYWKTILGILFLFQREENLLDANGFIEQSLDQMEKWINIKFILFLNDFHKLKALNILKPSPLFPK